MTIKVTLTEELTQPLIQEHLDTGRSVRSLIADAVAFYAKCRKAIEGTDRSIASGVASRGYFSKHEILMGKKDEE